MVKLAIISQLSLEKAIIRLQRITEFKDVLRDLSPVISILNETQSRISDFVPEVATGIGEANTMLNELSSEVTVPNSKNFETTKANEEVEKVLEESSILAEQRLKDQFPELPKIFSYSDVELPPVALTEDGGGVPIFKQVYSFLKQKNGRLSISEIASKLEIPPEDVRKAIDYLEKEGKIFVEK
jgi:response regulator of citrate/malate metabolism